MPAPHIEGNYVVWLEGGAFSAQVNTSAFIDGVYFYKLLSNGLEVGKGTILKSAHSGN